jgi:hypothetical protein
MILYHGTTRTWADDIVRNGPDPHFRMPGDPGPPEGFFLAPEEFRHIAERVAREKVHDFSQLGPAVLVVLEVPDHLIGNIGQDQLGKGCHWGHEVWFGIEYGSKSDFGILALRQTWPTISKSIVEVRP